MPPNLILVQNLELNINFSDSFVIKMLWKEVQVWAGLFYLRKINLLPTFRELKAVAILFITIVLVQAGKQFLFVSDVLWQSTVSVVLVMQWQGTEYKAFKA